MSDRVFSNASFSSRMGNKAQPILDDIKANPGTTQQDIESRTSTNSVTTGAVLQALILGERQIVERTDAGVKKYWASGAWSDSTWNLVPQIQNHLTTVDDPALVADLAAALGVTEAEIYGATTVGDALAALKLAER